MMACSSLVELICSHRARTTKIAGSVVPQRTGRCTSRSGKPSPGRQLESETFDAVEGSHVAVDIDGETGCRGRRSLRDVVEPSA